MKVHEKKFICAALAGTCLITMVQLMTAGPLDLFQKTGVAFLGIALPLLCAAHLTPDEDFVPGSKHFPLLEKFVPAAWILPVIGFGILLFHFGQPTGYAFILSVAVSICYYSCIEADAAKTSTPTLPDKNETAN